MSRFKVGDEVVVTQFPACGEIREVLATVAEIERCGKWYEVYFKTVEGEKDSWLDFGDDLLIRKVKTPDALLTAEQFAKLPYDTRKLMVFDDYNTLRLIEPSVTNITVEDFKTLCRILGIEENL